MKNIIQLNTIGINMTIFLFAMIMIYALVRGSRTKTVLSLII